MTASLPQGCILTHSSIFGQSRRLSPHPDPLPRGEREPHAPCEDLKSDRLAGGLSKVLPLPEGEGRGEGKGITNSTGSCNKPVARSEMRPPPRLRGALTVSQQITPEGG